MNRKELVLELRDALGVTPKYLGTPSCAYEIKTEDETYIIDREGAIKNSKGEEVTLESIINPASNEPAALTGITEPEKLSTDCFEVEIPLEGHNGVTLRNIVNMLSSKQKLIMKALELKEPLLDETFAEELGNTETGTLENFKAAILEIGQDKNPGLIFDFEKETIIFKINIGQMDPEKMIAFKDLVALINTTAKSLKHASFKLSQDENPKFAFRTWLTRLGMNGGAYKTSRKVLIANLEGSSAFRKPREEIEKS